MLFSSVSILGCGWLGLPLAKKLSEHYQVHTSVTNQEKAQSITQQGIACEVIKLPIASPSQLSSAFWQSEVLIIAIPPKFKQGATDYAQNIQQLIEHMNQLVSCKLVLLISSTGVYPEHEQSFDETSCFSPETEKQYLLWQAEQAVLNFKQQSIVLRLGGLVNEQRHPGRWFSGKTGLSNGQQWVNMIHQADAIGIIELLLSQAKQLTQAQIVNGVSATNANKQAFYQQASKQLALTVPEFAPSPLPNTKGKRVLSKQLTALNYQWHYPDLMQWLS